MSFARHVQDILHYGKQFYHPDTDEEKRDSYLKAAAKLYATTDGIDRKNTLMYWWVEGIRDFCLDTDDISVGRSLLRDEAAKHITEGRY